MMNAAMDRWGVASSSIYNNNNRKSLNKENESRTLNANDSNKNRKPLSQKKQQHQQPEKEHTLNSKPKLSVLTSQKSYDDESSGSEGSDLSASAFERKSNAAAEILDTIEANVDDGPFLIDPELDAPPPIHNIVRTPMDEEEMNDVSTIAGDTFAGIMMDADIAEAVPPYPSIDDMSLDMSPPIKSPPGKNVSCDAMITPTFSVINHRKKTFRRTYGDDEDYDDESTKPESPDKDDDEELVRAEEGKKSRNRSFKKKKSKDGADKRFRSDKDEDDLSALSAFEGEKKFEATQNRPHRERRRFRSMMCCGCLLATFLMMAIGVLGYTLYAIRKEDNGALSLFDKEFWKKVGDDLLGREDNKAVDDAIGESSGTLAPSDQDINTGTGTIPPSDYDYETGLKMEEIRSIVLSASIEKEIPGINGAALRYPGSVQFSVLEWLVQDPKYDSYSEQRIIQRYALGCFYKSILGEDSGDDYEESGKINADADEVRNTWMVEDDECTSWLNTNTKSKQTCLENGMIRSVHLEGVELTGTLAPELALVSDSLESIYLTKNKIRGTIPSVYGKLTNLKRLQLSRNTLEGTLNGPDLLSPLVKLEIIGLGGNKLTGTIPKELGSMPSMYYLNFPYNKFSGTIPSDWNSTKLKHLSIAMNELTGTIPYELTRIESLNNLFLFGNNLDGTIPELVCRGPFVNMTYNDMNVTIDCESVSCSCCGCNGVTPPPASEVGSDPPIGGGFFEGIFNITNDTTDVNETANDVDSSSVLVTDSSFSEALFNISQGGSTPEANDSEASSSTNAPSTVTALTLPPGSFPFVSDAAFAEAVYALNGDTNDNNDYGCQGIAVGSSCYTTGWSIDFDITNRNCRSDPQSNPPPATQDYDIVALYPFKGDVQRPPSNRGTQVPLSEAVFWATSCGLADCDGVLANGQIYYRNNYPKQTSPLWIEWWPVNPGSMMQLLWLRADNFGTAVVIAESQPFLVSNRCR